MSSLRIRLGIALLLVLLALGTAPQFAAAVRLQPPDARPAGQARLVSPFRPTLCAATCTCSYADLLINGQPYTNGKRGHSFCTSSCGARNCEFRPNSNGCGPVLYLGCTDLDCRSDSPPPARPLPVHTSVPVPPQNPPDPVAPPPAGPPSLSDTACTAPLRWLELQPPVIRDVYHHPPFPVLPSQVTSRETVDDLVITLYLVGGRVRVKVKEEVKECPQGGRPPADCPDDVVTRCRVRIQAEHADPVVAVEAQVNLSSAAQSWIRGSLARRYTGASVRRGAQILRWSGSQQSGFAELPSWTPLDPGRYQAEVTVTTAGTPVSEPQSAVRTHSVTVSLRDTTLAR